MNIANDRDTLNRYMKEIRVDLLSINQEIDLSKIIQNSHKNSKERKIAINKLILHNLRFVINVAKKYQGNGLQLNDLIEEGNLGLYEAAIRFNYLKHNTKFITYAVHWIKQSILLALSNNVRTVRIPLNIHNRYNEFKKIRNRFLTSNGEYTLDNIADEMIIPRRDLEEMERFISHGISFDDPLSSDDDGSKTRLDMFVPDEKNCKYEIEHTNLKLKIALNKLSDRDKNIIKDFYGIEKEYPLSKENLSNKYGFTVTMINKIIRDTRDVLKYLIID